MRNTIRMVVWFPVLAGFPLLAETYEKARLGAVRFEVHEGGHGMSQEHYREALKWFAQPKDNP